VEDPKIEEDRFAVCRFGSARKGCLVFYGEMPCFIDRTATSARENAPLDDLFIFGDTSAAKNER